MQVKNVSVMIREVAMRGNVTYASGLCINYLLQPTKDAPKKKAPKEKMPVEGPETNVHGYSLHFGNPNQFHVISSQFLLII